MMPLYLGKLVRPISIGGLAPSTFMAGHLLVTYKYLTSTLQVPYKYLTSTLQVPYKYLTSTLQVPYKYLTSTLQVPYKYLTSTLQVPAYDSGRYSKYRPSGRYLRVLY